MTTDRRQILLAGAIAVAAAGLASSAQAQLAVYDPAAVAQAIKQVSQGLQQIQILKDQLNQQAQMIAKLGVDVTGPLGQIVSEATGLLKQAQGLGYQATDLSKSFAQMYPDDLSGMPAADIAGRLAAWNQASRRTLQEAMEVQSQIAQAQPATASAVSAAVAASQNAAGQTAAVQATNQLLAVLSTQLIQLQTLLITQARQGETAEAERRALVAKAEADRQRNSVVNRPPRRFTKESSLVARALLIVLPLLTLIAGCGPSASGTAKTQETHVSEAEARAMAERAEAARGRNSKVTRPARRFTEDSL